MDDNDDSDDIRIVMEKIKSYGGKPLKTEPLVVDPPQPARSSNIPEVPVKTTEVVDQQSDMNHDFGLDRIQDDDISDLDDNDVLTIDTRENEEDDDVIAIPTDPVITELAKEASTKISFSPNIKPKKKDKKKNLNHLSVVIKKEKTTQAKKILDSIVSFCSTLNFRLNKKEKECAMIVLEEFGKKDLKSMEKISSNRIKLILKMSVYTQLYITTHEKSGEDVTDFKALYDSFSNWMSSLISKGVESTQPTMVDFRPDQPSFSFIKWSNSQDKLNMKKITDIAIGKVANPLGCVFDTKLGFLFTGEKEILCSNEKGELTGSLIGGLTHPSALCVIRNGEAIAILDDEKIYIFEVFSNRLIVVCDKLNRSCRGLAVTEDGYLVTTQRHHGEVTVVAYDPKRTNKIKDRTVFPIVDNGHPNPCFISCVGNRLAITDLGQNIIVMMKFYKGLLICEDVVQVGPTSDYPIKFHFISGVVMDSRHELLVADAQKRNLYFMTSRGTKPSLVTVTNGSFPYSAAFAVSPNGYILSSGRQSNCMSLFKITKHEEDIKMDETDDLFQFSK